MMANPDELLREHGLRRTLGRVQVLDFFLAQKIAISHSDLSKNFDGQLDRASLYRTLQDFESHGIIHKVPDDEVSVKYAICHGPCSEDAHHDSHLHFKCYDCKQTYCLDSASLPSFEIPSGFKAQSAEVLIHGQCKACA